MNRRRASLTLLNVPDFHCFRLCVKAKLLHLSNVEPLVLVFVLAEVFTLGSSTDVNALDSFSRFLALYKFVCMHA